MGQSSEQFIELQEQDGGIPMFMSPPKEAYRMLTPPMMFKSLITPVQWYSLSNKEQDCFVAVAKILLNL